VRTVCSDALLDLLYTLHRTVYYAKGSTVTVMLQAAGERARAAIMARQPAVAATAAVAAMRLVQHKRCTGWALLRSARSEATVAA
jgi:hypothetical protein